MYVRILAPVFDKLRFLSMSWLCVFTHGHHLSECTSLRVPVLKHVDGAGCIDINLFYFLRQHPITRQLLVFGVHHYLFRVDIVISVERGASGYTQDATTWVIIADAAYKTQRITVQVAFVVGALQVTICHELVIMSQRFPLLLRFDWLGRGPKHSQLF